VEIAACVAAVVLGVAWAAVRGLGWALERRSLEAFRAVEHSPVLPQAPKVSPVSLRAEIDKSLWDRGRIRAYVRAVARPAPPPLAVLRIPRLEFEAPVLEGTDEWTLDRAVGHIEGTARPGQRGNVGLSAHRDGFFRVLKDVTHGDVLELALPGEVRRFRVHRLSIVGPDDVGVLSPSQGERLTLVTCYPFYFVGPAPKRFIVAAASE
jgi:sortase A